MNFSLRFLTQTIQPWYNLPEEKLKSIFKHHWLLFGFSKQYYLLRIKHVTYTLNRQVKLLLKMLKNSQEVHQTQWYIILHFRIIAEVTKLHGVWAWNVTWAFIPFEVHGTEMIKKNTSALHRPAELSPEKCWLLKIASSNLEKRK